MKEILISVIIPVYKVEKYLDRCIESIVNQTYKKLEIILVDDGSPDRCPQICDDWAQKDERIKVIHKENEGVSKARNVGIENSTGDYISFIDSDDYIELDTYECINKIYNQEPKDMYIFDYDIIYNSFTEKNAIKTKPTKRFQVEMFSTHGIGGVVFNKIYSKKIIGKFNENVSMCEDLLFNLELSNNDIDYYYIDKSFYNYVQNSESALHSKYKSDISRMLVVERIACYMEKIDTNIYNKVQYEYITDFEDIYLYNKKYNQVTISKKEYRKKSKEYLKSGLLKSKNITIKQKVKIIVILYFSKIYEMLKYNSI